MGNLLTAFGNGFAIFLHIFDGVELFDIFTTVHEEFVKFLGELDVVEIETDRVEELLAIGCKNNWIENVLNMKNGYTFWDFWLNFLQSKLSFLDSSRRRAYRVAWARPGASTFTARYRISNGRVLSLIYLKKLPVNKIIFGVDPIQPLELFGCLLTLVNDVGERVIRKLAMLRFLSHATTKNNFD